MRPPTVKEKHVVNPRYPGRSGTHKHKMRSSGFDSTKIRQAKNTGSYKSGGGGKPPKKGGGLCVQIAPFAAVPALLLLGHAIVQSFL